jgi:hypothetical protein
MCREVQQSQSAEGLETLREALAVSVSGGIGRVQQGSSNLGQEGPHHD